MNFSFLIFLRKCHRYSIGLFSFSVCVEVQEGERGVRVCERASSEVFNKSYFIGRMQLFLFCVLYMIESNKLNLSLKFVIPQSN